MKEVANIFKTHKRKENNTKNEFRLIKEASFLSDKCRNKCSLQPPQSPQKMQVKELQQQLLLLFQKQQQQNTQPLIHDFFNSYLNNYYNDIALDNIINNYFRVTNGISKTYQQYLNYFNCSQTVCMPLTYSVFNKKAAMVDDCCLENNMK